MHNPDFMCIALPDQKIKFDGRRRGSGVSMFGGVQVMALVVLEYVIISLLPK